MTLPQAKSLGAETIHSPRVRVFTDLAKLSEMLEMAKTEPNNSIVAERYNVDRTTVYYHKRKYGIITVQGTRRKYIKRDKSGIQIKRLSTANSPIVKTIVPHLDVDGGLINEGASYKDYYKKDKAERMSEYQRNLQRRIEEENKKARYCDNPDEILIRQSW